ncbi:hypothetical protein F5148DRAFT_603666 [Russula earlei]|uniref:Uncharacterized protein n=1 Tax=Russula earlei TaxID=71964 RepID=A0ACC0UF76_9AGAM|nr:hypothetical protein F5148DRAFT_603666 [Russula earlei]
MINLEIDGVNLLLPSCCNAIFVNRKGMPDLNRKLKMGANLPFESSIEMAGLPGRGRTCVRVRVSARVWSTSAHNTLAGASLQIKTLPRGDKSASTRKMPLRLRRSRVAPPSPPPLEEEISYCTVVSCLRQGTKIGCAPPKQPVPFPDHQTPSSLHEHEAMERFFRPSESETPIVTRGNTILLAGCTGKRDETRSIPSFRYPCPAFRLSRSGSAKGGYSKANASGAGGQGAAGPGKDNCVRDLAALSHRAAPLSKPSRALAQSVRFALKIRRPRVVVPHQTQIARDPLLTPLRSMESAPSSFVRRFGPSVERGVSKKTKTRAIAIAIEQQSRQTGTSGERSAQTPSLLFLMMI